LRFAAADGGTRTAAITGGFVALADAIDTLLKKRAITAKPIAWPVAAVSVGIYRGTPVLDLDYAEDSNAETDMECRHGTAAGAFVESRARRRPRVSPPRTRSDVGPLRCKVSRSCMPHSSTPLSGMLKNAPKRLIVATANKASCANSAPCWPGCRTS